MGPKNPAIPRKGTFKSLKILDESHSSKEKFFRNSKKRVSICYKNLDIHPGEDKV